MKICFVFWIFIWLESLKKNAEGNSKNPNREKTKNKKRKKRKHTKGAGGAKFNAF